VSDRWVCKRCFADNDEPMATCQRCGLLRGAESTATDQQGWAASEAAASPPSDPGWRRWLRFWWVPALGIVLLVGYLASARRDGAGEITAGGTLSIEEVRVGDCFDFAQDQEEVSEVDARRCDEPHAYEMFHVATWGGSSDYPSDDQMVSFVLDECLPAFERFVGLAYETSELDFDYFVPLEAGWAAGDRVFQCALYDPGDRAVTTSLEGAAR
jgi:Septum formation